MTGQNAPALLISALVHAVLLGALGLYKYSKDQEEAVVALETVMEEERDQQEFEQDLQIDTTVSETLSISAGGMVSTSIGSAATTPISKIKVANSEALRDPDVRITTIGDISIPVAGRLGVDLGEGEVSGEVGARVAGYGAAMHRITQEVIRMMRKQPVMAVWLFDASISLKDDRKEIQENFHKIYEELNIAKEEATRRGQRYAALETMICSFGGDVQKLLPKPTDELEAINKAIELVKEDSSGVENTFTAIGKVIDEYAVAAARSDRKLAIIVMTDETGNDAAQLEDVVSKAERFKVPVYFLGREAIFGYPYAQIRWVDPETKLPHWVRVNRGPETAFPEALQYDGFHGRWDGASSGFGPYPQVRLARESGGIYFMLASEEKDLAGWAARSQRKFDDLAMKEYVPTLLATRDYVESRNRSDFRKSLFEVIMALDPERDTLLNLETNHYPVNEAKFAELGLASFERCVRSLQRLNEGVKRLEAIAPLRAEENEPRWRAAYDLAYAQLLAYRVSQFQFLLALDAHKKNPPKLKDPKNNEWIIQHVTEMLTPDAAQIAATKVDIKELEEQRKLALTKYEQVIAEHPGTPWAQRAQQEKARGFGIRFRDYFWDPKYYDKEYMARVPKL